MNGTDQIFDCYEAPVVSSAIGTIEVVAEMATGNKGIIYMSRGTGLSLGARKENKSQTNRLSELFMLRYPKSHWIVF